MMDARNSMNVADAIKVAAEERPYQLGIVFPAGRDKQGNPFTRQLNFKQLNEMTNQFAHGLRNYGIGAKQRTLVMVRPNIEFIAAIFALLQIGAVPVIIDPGMERKAFLQCVKETAPENFIGVSESHILRILYPKAFESVNCVITTGTWKLWSGAYLRDLQSEDDSNFDSFQPAAEDEGLIAFTSGSTGIPKGVVFTHGGFQAQVAHLRNDFEIQPGEVDLPGLFSLALFNPALGLTTIIPDMDITAPATLNPAYLVEAIQTYGVTNSFGSPIIWKLVGNYCKENGISLPSYQRIIMAGAPVEPSVLETMYAVAPNATITTPFGATEALPISIMDGKEILSETAALSNQGHGNCVGYALENETLKIIEVRDETIEQWADALEVPQGVLGEIVVKGPVVSPRYVARPVQTAQAKIYEADGSFWHRMGDLGFFDEKGRVWFCGRKSHRLETEDGILCPIHVEALANQLPHVTRSAVIGVGEKGKEKPVLLIEENDEIRKMSGAEQQALLDEAQKIRSPYLPTTSIKSVEFVKAFPVDVRHNAKINRELLQKEYQTKN
jgi:acyl-coenzyme A synthetase/AMP-(fatty) acid ligase